MDKREVEARMERRASIEIQLIMGKLKLVMASFPTPVIANGGHGKRLEACCSSVPS